jgi:hypothetical protein
MTLYEQKQLRKSIYIPKVAAGQITNLVASQKIGISINSVVKLKQRYRLYGSSVFKRPSHPAYNRKYSDDFIGLILSLYHKYYEGTPFAAFWRCLRDIEKIDLPLPSLRYILKKHGIKSGNEYRKSKGSCERTQKRTILNNSSASQTSAQTISTRFFSFSSRFLFLIPRKIEKRNISATSDETKSKCSAEK